MISEWKRYYGDERKDCLFTDCITGYGIKELPHAVRKILSSKLDRYAEKGMIWPAGAGDGCRYSECR